MSDLTIFVAVSVFAFVLAGFVKGVIGMGLPTIVVGVLSLLMSPAEAVVLMLVPSLLTNIWQGVSGPHFGAIMRRLWPVLIGICAGTWLADAIGIGLLTPEAAGRARVALGVTLVIYGALGLAKIRIRVGAAVEPWLGPAAGIGTGALSAATGIYMIPAIPYYQAIGLDKDALVQAQGVSYAVSTVALIALLLSGGVLNTANAAISLAAVAPALAGMVLGQYVRTSIRADAFRFCFHVGILGLGAHLALVHR